MLNTILKEIEDHLKSLRFTLTVVMMIILMTAGGFFFIPDFREQTNDYERNRSQSLSQLQENASQNGGLFKVFSFNFEGSWVYAKPNYMSFLSEGQDRNLPNAFRPSAFRIYGPSKQVRSNILLWQSEAIDWALIVGILLSFTAIVLVYDAVSGERESGTLRLYLSNSVSRASILLAKFLGAFFCIASAFTIGALINLIIVFSIGGVLFNGTDLIFAGAAYLLSLVYCSVFIMLGLFVSCRTKTPATSLVVSLLCWVVFVIVIPRSGSVLASRLTDLPLWDEGFGKAWSAENEYLEAFHKKNPDMVESGHWSPGESLKLALGSSDEWTKYADEYRNQMIEQVDKALKATLVSPYSAYIQSLQELTESGIVHYRTFFNQVQDYRLAMRRCLLDMYPVDVGYYGWDDKKTLEKITQPIDYRVIPVFEETRTGWRTVAVRTIPGVLLLVIFNALFFAGAFVSFLRYDVR